MTELTIETIREFVLAGHGNFDKVQDMLARQPELLNTVVMNSPSRQAPDEPL